MQRAEKVIDLLTEHVENHPDVALVLVYGSYARGTATDASDLDILFVSDSEDADRLAISFVLDDRTVDFWPVRWAFLDAIASASGARPWALAASIILDGRVVYARARTDAERFDSIRARVAAFIASDDPASALAATDAAYASVVQAVGRMHIAGTRGDDAALRIHAWDAIGASSNCVAVLARTPLRRSESANIGAIADLGLVPSAVMDRLRMLTSPVEAAELAATADEYAAAVAELVSSSRTALRYEPEYGVVGQPYAELHEHLVKVRAAAASGDGLRARAEAHAVTRELAAMLHTATEGRQLSGTDRMDGVLTNGAMPGAGDLLEAHGTGDLDGTARELDARLRTWMTQRGVSLNVVADLTDLKDLLRTHRSNRDAPA